MTIPFRSGRVSRLGIAVAMAGALAVTASCSSGATGIRRASDTSPLYAIRVATLGFPSLIAPIPQLIKQLGFDQKHGFREEISTYTNIAPYYASLTSGQVDVLAGGPTIAQKLYLQGLPVRIVSTLTDLSPMVVVSRNPAITTATQLRGHKLAASVGSAEFQVLSMYLQAHGINVLKDVHVVNADPGLTISNLAAGRVDAGLLWGPNAVAGMAKQHYRVILQGDSAWREVTGGNGYELAWIMRSALLSSHTAASSAWTAAVQDAVGYITSHPDEAAAAMEAATKMPAAAYKGALGTPRITYDVKPATDPAVQASLMKMFDAAVKAGFDAKAPDSAIFPTS